MNDKGHFLISVAKSAIRIISCIIALKSIIVLPIGFLIAEILGILEEVFDKR